jgi:hypothetical protein
MFACQDAMKAKIAELEAQLLAQREKVKCLIRAQNSSRELLRDAYHDFEKCPVCGKKFKSIRYVDLHIEKLHPSHLMAWRSLRVDNPIDPSARVRELETEIAALKALMNEQTKKFAETLALFEQRRLAQRTKGSGDPAPTVTFIEFEPPTPRPRKQPPPPPCPKRPIGQSIVNVTDVDAEEASDTDPIEHVRRKTAKSAQRITTGLPANYVTPAQVAKILRYDHPVYERLQKSARDQLERDFPMDARPRKARPPVPVKKTERSGDTTTTAVSAQNPPELVTLEVSDVSTVEEEEKHDRAPPRQTTTLPLYSDDSDDSM